MFVRRLMMISFFLLIGSTFCWAGTIDSGLFTTYTTDAAKTTLYWVVCGSIGKGDGCYGAGQRDHSGRSVPSLRAPRLSTLERVRSRDFSM